MKHDDDKYAKRSFGHLKDEALTKLGTVKTGNLFLGILYLVAAITALTWILFHPIYLQTGTPMFKYGLAMIVLGPFYLLWAVCKILSAYVFNMKKA